MGGESSSPVVADTGAKGGEHGSHSLPSTPPRVAPGVAPCDADGASPLPSWIVTELDKRAEREATARMEAEAKAESRAAEQQVSR